MHFKLSCLKCGLRHMLYCKQWKILGFVSPAAVFGNKDKCCLKK